MNPPCPGVLAVPSIRCRTRKSMTVRLAFGLSMLVTLGCGSGHDLAPGVGDGQSERQGVSKRTYHVRAFFPGRKAPSGIDRQDGRRWTLYADDHRWRQRRRGRQTPRHDRQLAFRATQRHFLRMRTVPKGPRRFSRRNTTPNPKSRARCRPRGATPWTLMFRHVRPPRIPVTVSCTAHLAYLLLPTLRGAGITRRNGRSPGALVFCADAVNEISTRMCLACVLPRACVLRWSVLSPASAGVRRCTLRTIEAGHRTMSC